MPNWCDNLMEVVGPEDVLTRFKNKAKLTLESGVVQDFSFEALYPLPEGEDWYEWHVANWGTKWDVDYKDIREVTNDPNRWVLTFDTAWAPPVEFFDKVSQDYPDLTFSLIYAETGMDLSGQKVWNENVESNQPYMEDFQWSVASLVSNYIQRYEE